MLRRGKRRRRRKRRDKAKTRGKKDRMEEEMMETEAAEAVIMIEEAAVEEETMIEVAEEEVIMKEAVGGEVVKTGGVMIKVIMTDLQREEDVVEVEATDKVKKNDKCGEGMMTAISENRSISTMTIPQRTH